MNRIGLLELLLVLPFPIWPLVAFRLVRLVVVRKTAPWIGLLAGLVCAALAVGFFVVFSQWLQQPLLANAAAIIYGSPAFFFILAAVANWCLRGCYVQQVSASQATLGGQTLPASCEEKGTPKETS